MGLLKLFTCMCLAINIVGTAFGADFSYSASSPSSPLHPTDNNGATQLSLNPTNGTNLSTMTDITISELVLNTTIGSEQKDIWNAVPFKVDLVIKDSGGTSGLFTFSGNINGSTRIGSATLDLLNPNVAPATQQIGNIIYTVKFSSYSGPGPSTSPGVNGRTGFITVRVGTSVAPKPTTKIKPIEAGGIKNF